MTAATPAMTLQAKDRDNVTELHRVALGAGAFGLALMAAPSTAPGQLTACAA